MARKQRIAGCALRPDPQTGRRRGSGRCVVRGPQGLLGAERHHGEDPGRRRSLGLHTSFVICISRCCRRRQSDVFYKPGGCDEGDGKQISRSTPSILITIVSIYNSVNIRGGGVGCYGIRDDGYLWAVVTFGGSDTGG